MPKVISGVQGAKDFATDGTVQTIPDITNRQGARKQLTLQATRTAEKVLEGLKAAETKPPAQESTKSVESVGQKAPSETKAAPESVDDPNEGVEAADLDLAERARRSISRKHRELKKAEAELGKLKVDLSDAESFSKQNYARAATAEERVETLQRELEALKAKAPEPAKAAPALQKPEAKDFYDEKGQFKLAEYTEAVAEYSARKAVTEKESKDAAERAEAAKKASEEAREAAFQRVKKLTEEQSKDYKDWDERVPTTAIRLHDAVGAYLVNSKYPGHIAYYLATHPEYVEGLNKMHPFEAIAELGELSIRWKKKPPEQEQRKEPESRVPAPITPLSGNGSVGVQTDPSKMTPAQLRQYDRERAMAKRAR
jgi:hypothetical protein